MEEYRTYICDSLLIQVYVYIYELSDSNAEIVFVSSFFYHRLIQSSFSMAEITQLPDEIIVFILENKNIAIKDVINFKSTCERLQCITLDNCFWKKKICQRYFYIFISFILILDLINIHRATKYFVKIMRRDN